MPLNYIYPSPVPLSFTFEQMIILESAQGFSLGVDEPVVLLLHSLKRKIKTNNVLQLPCTSYEVMCMVIDYCRSMLEPSISIDDAEFYDLADVDLLNLIQAAHHLKIKSLMDQTCRILVEKVKKNSSSKIMQEFDIDERYVQETKRPRRDPGSDRLRSHRKEAFIKRSDGVEVHNSHFDFVVKMKKQFSKKEDPVFNAYVAEFLEFSNIVLTENCLEHIKSPSFYVNPNLRFSDDFSVFSDPPMTIAVEKLRRAIRCLRNVTTKDPGLADHLSSEVASRLILLLDNINLSDIQYTAAKILSRLSFDKCRDVMKEAVPVLLKVICSDDHQAAVLAAITLTRLASEVSEVFEVSHFKAVQHAVTKHKHDAVLTDLMLFLVFVCRGYDLSSSDKVKVVLPILEGLFKIEGNSFADHTPLVRACYALSYLTFAKPVKVKNHTCKRLMEFTLHASSSLAGSALGVVGNIVRWGSPMQIQYLVKHCKLLQCLGQKVLCSRFKKFQMEGCQIISNIATRRKKLIEDMDEVVLINLLIKLLEADDSDVKMEAAWAIFNMRYNDKYKHEHIDNYEEDTVKSNASEVNSEVEEERNELITSENEVDTSENEFERDIEVDNLELEDILEDLNLKIASDTWWLTIVTEASTKSLLSLFHLELVNVLFVEYLLSNHVCFIIDDCLD
ncbi:hypothetical protein POM88_006289 [Heracleum sosnowskyi]|uniref:Uncharacterized protein n=1 Tax=Heracleum sosnowskyi TaxID=360622 RepID=A0AAD8J375_9APIA|nr:hypothetical protein POM88_006289 [Heracleum sosnowskyi]